MKSVGTVENSTVIELIGARTESTAAPVDMKKDKSTL